MDFNNTYVVNDTHFLLSSHLRSLQKFDVNSNFCKLRKHTDHMTLTGESAVAMESVNNPKCRLVLSNKCAFLDPKKFLWHCSRLQFNYKRTFLLIEDKGPAFQYLVKKMKDQSDKTAYVKGKTRKNMGGAATE